MMMLTSLTHLGLIGAVIDLTGLLVVSFSLLALATGLGFFIWLAYTRSKRSTPLHVGILHYTTRRLGILAYRATPHLAAFIPLVTLHIMAQTLEAAAKPTKASNFGVN